ncbi:CheW protein [Stella humosa]|uniref:Chemotaxis protein CheW n=1 Tax=Stella humosa TaxID=94 RepID=A0A3N1KR42_9PROT|nr:chemotaxis protein CheW [Stella humosa]ROP80790.1 CheW protein [Stella humosa]BBK33422.1 chemotaxis protein CheW [Stella humosa]
MGSRVPAAGAEDRAVRRFLVFRVDQRSYAVTTEDVAEIVRLPTVARVPLAPPSLLGLGNVRGTVMPLVSLRSMLGLPAAAIGDGARAIVLDLPARIAVVVDAVHGVTAVDVGHIEARSASLGTEPGERLAGAFRLDRTVIDAAGEVVRILDLHALIALAFAASTRAVPPPSTVARQDRSKGRSALADEASDRRGKLVTFDVAGQEYALPLEVIREIITIPAQLALVPRAEALVLGIATLRDGLLPLLSLRGLLGFPPRTGADGREKVVVVDVAGNQVGLVADRMLGIVAADDAAIEPTPAILASRTGGEARIKAIYRSPAGRKPVSILATDQLFREDVMHRLGPASRESRDGASSAPAGTTIAFLVFRLGDSEFGLAVEMIDEVAKVPAQITRVPRAPKFLEGVVNLRGEVLPIVDQRRRFDMARLEGEGDSRRLVVVRAGRLRAGLIVDSVSEVLRTTAAEIEPPPDLTGEASRLIIGLVSLPASGRIVLLLDPAQLLSPAEQGVLERLGARAAQAGT